MHTFFAVLGIVLESIPAIDICYRHYTAPRAGKDHDMTETTPVTATRKPAYRAPGHDRPCWCDGCILITVDELLDNRARLLRGTLADRLYADGLETRMAGEIMHAIPAGKRADVLEHMVTWDHVYPHVTAVTCLLDETDDRTYKAVGEVSRVLLGAIRAQDRAPAALRILLTEEICARRRLPDL
jgi:hypothetical protein